MPQLSPRIGCSLRSVTFVTGWAGMSPICERKGRTSRKTRRGTIGSLAVISSTHTRWIGFTGGFSQSAGFAGTRPCREPFTSRRIA